QRQGRPGDGKLRALAREGPAHRESRRMDQGVPVMSDVATRTAFGDALVRLGAANDRIVALDGDVATSVMTAEFGEKFPDRYYQCGIAESNMVGVACGLAMSGHIPFVASFACFITGRFDTIRMSVGYNRSNVRIVGTHVGIG